MLIDLVESYGGDVVQFSGDALTILWRCAETDDDKGLAGGEAQAVILASACAAAMQRAIAGDARLAGGPLTMHMALGCGAVTVAHLGGVWGRWVLVMDGPAMAQIALAEPLGGSGDVVLSPRAAKALRETDGSTRADSILEEPYGDAHAAHARLAMGGDLRALAAAAAAVKHSLGDVPATRGGGTGASHLLIGVSKENDGFASPEAKAECASLLRAAYATGLVLDHHAKSQIVVTMQVQPNKADEFMGLALLRALIELQAVDLLGIVLTSEERFGEVTTLEAAAARTRATLNALGLHNTRVLVQHASKRACQLEELYARAPQTGARPRGTRPAGRRGRTSKRSRARSHRRRVGGFLDGSRALVACSAEARASKRSRGVKPSRRFVRKPSRRFECRAGVRLVVIHSQTDAADFASRSPELFREKTLGAVVMGGVVATGLGVEDDGVVPCAALVPDADASNNRADEVAATFFTARCQALGVPMTVISRHLALACRLPRSVYDALGARGGPVGASVCDAQRASIEHLWRQVHLPAGHRDRQRKLADRCDATWFRDTFCGDDDALVDPPPSPSSPSTPRTPRRSRDAPPLPPASEDVWPYVSSFNVYTPLALLAAVPRIAAHFYDTRRYDVRGTTHDVVGSTQADPGARDVTELRLFLCRLIFKGVLMNASHFPDDPPSFAIDGVGTVDLDDAVPDCVDLHHERLVAKQETISKTCLLYTSPSPRD